MPLLETIQLKKYFGGTHAVDDVNFTVDRAEIVSLIGSNGAGKTTLINLLSGFFPPTSGTIHFDGREVTSTPTRERIRLGIVRSFQIVNLFDRMKVIDNVKLSIFSREGKTKQALSLAASHSDVEKEALETLKLFGIEEEAELPSGKIAQGQRKLLDVALAYALNPKLILLDEPTSGVSTTEKHKIMSTISSAVRSRGISGVIVEHDMDVVFNYSDRIVGMHQGKILASDKPERFLENDIVKATLLGVS